MKNAEKNIVKILLKSQLLIEKVKFKTILDNNGRDKYRNELHISEAIIKELERQLTEITTTKSIFS